jgi:tetratricopeptide (TPR) repeat protein
MKSINSVFRITVIILLAAGFPIGAVAQKSGPDKRAQFTEARTQLEQAIVDQNIEQIVRLRSRFESFFDEPDLEAQAHYFIGLAGYRLHTLPSELDKKQKGNYLNDAVDHLKKAVSINEDFAEAHALLSGSYGLKASGGIFSGMKYGPKSNNEIDRALQLVPSNPRVLLLDGIGLLFTPSMFGGDTEKAITQFKEAAKEFEKFTPKDETMPHWGKVEVYAWLGQAYEKQKKFELAKQAYEKALELNPDYGWVKNNLLPKLAEQ